MKTKFKELFNNKKNRTIAIVLILALIAGLVVYFVVSNNSDSKKKDVKSKTKTEQVKKDKKTEEKAKTENPASGDSSATSSSSSGSKKSGGGSTSGGGSGSGGGGQPTGHVHTWVTGYDTEQVYTSIGSHVGGRCSGCGTIYETTSEAANCPCETFHGWSTYNIIDYGYVDNQVPYTYCSGCGARK